MKIKMLMAMALSGLLATSVSFAETDTETMPVDDMTTTTSDSMSTSDSMAAPDASAPGQSTDMSNPGGNTATAPMPSDNVSTSTGTSSDDISADTATGDDDY